MCGERGRERAGKIGLDTSDTMEKKLFHEFFYHIQYNEKLKNIDRDDDSIFLIFIFTFLVYLFLLNFFFLFQI